MSTWKKIIIEGSGASLNSLSLATALTVANGGTGVTSLTDGGILLGSGNLPITSLGQATNGQLVIGSTGGDPVLATLTQGSNISITNTAGGIQIGTTGLGSGTVQSVSASGLENGLTLTSTLSSTSPEIVLGGTLGSIANSQLNNSTVSYGGVSLALGASDATPAFNLSDATNLDLTTGVIDTLPTANGGTNIDAYTTGDILYSSASNVLAKLGIGSAGQVLTVAGGIVSWATPTTGDLESVANATNGGIDVTNGTGPDATLAIDINNLSAASINVANDFIAFSDESAAGDPTKKESIADLMGLVAGTGLTSTNGVLSTVVNPGISSSIYTNITGDVSITAAGVSSVNSVQANSVALGTDTTGNYVASLGTGTGVTIASNTGEGSQPTIAVNYGSSANQAVEGDTTLAVLGTSNEIEVSSGASAALGAGNRSITVGLPNDVTITNNLTVSNNAVIAGDLLVSGTASFTHSDNLDIADKFITLSSGSTSAGDGGIIVAQALSGGGPTQLGEGFGYNATAGTKGRWGVTGSLDNDSGAIVPLDYMVTTTISATSPSAAPSYGGTSGYGNLHVDTATNTPYIYV